MPWINIMRYQRRPLSLPRLSSYVPLIRVLAYRVNAPVRGPDFATPSFASTNRMYMVTHVRECDESFLRLPDRECAAGDGALYQEGIAYQPFRLFEVSPHSTIGQIHREQQPEMPETKPCSNAHHPDHLFLQQLTCEHWNRPSTGKCNITVRFPTTTKSST